MSGAGKDGGAAGASHACAAPFPKLSIDKKSSGEYSARATPVIMTSRFFRGFVEDVPALASFFSVVEFQKGETILQRGEDGTWVGLVLTGELSVVIDDTPMGAVQPGDFVGEMILFFERGVRQATVVASRDGDRMLTIRHP